LKEEGQLKPGKRQDESKDDHLKA